MNLLAEKIIAGLVLLLFICGAAFTIGSKYESRVLTAKYEKQIGDMVKQQNQALKDAVKQAKDNAEKQQSNIKSASEADQQHEAAQVKTQVFYKTIHDKVIQYVQTHPAATDCSVNPDFLRIWNEANQPSADGSTTTTPSDSASQSDAKVPAAASGG